MLGEQSKQAARAAMRAQRQRLVAVGAIFVAVQALIVVFSWMALEVVNVARAYAGGEGFYSKAQKSAVIALHRLAETGDDAFYDVFQHYIAIPVGDRIAREELEKPQRDSAVIRRGLLQGRNHPDDATGIADFFLLLSDWGPFKIAVDDWRIGDGLNRELIDDAGRLRAAIKGHASHADVMRFLGEVDRIDGRLTVLEANFAGHMIDAAHDARGMALLGLGAGGSLLVAGGILLMWRIGRRGAQAELRALESEERMMVAKDEAEHANKAKSVFLANMSHELRTPLNAVIGFSQTIKNEMFGPVGQPRYQEYAGDIESAGRHLLSLINDILDLSRIDSDKIELREQICEICEIIRNAVALCGERATTSGINLGVDVGGRLPPLFADELRLKQVLINLLANAIKFTPPRGSVEIVARRAGCGGILIRVADTGIGMSQDEIAVALKRFGQVDHGFNRKFEGTGLGLPLAIALVELHGGTLTIKSTPNVGTTVDVLFPQSRVRAEVDEPAVAAISA